MTCEKCGIPIAIGDYPFCPHGVGAGVKHPDVTYPGGLTLHNLGPEPVTVYSETERRTIMRERGLREGVWHIPEPGSDKSRVTTSWATVDPYTLAAAKALVDRVAKEKATDRVDGTLETLQVGWADTGPIAAGFTVQTE